MESKFMKTRERTCPICEEPNKGARPGRYSQPPWSIIDCVKCGFPYVQTVLISEELVEKLAWEKTYAVEQERRKREQPIYGWFDAKTRWRLHIFPRTEPVDIINRLGEPGPVIDLGCGSGDHLIPLADRFTPYGVEISSALAARARRTLAGRRGEIVENASKDGLATFPDGFFAGALLRPISSMMPMRAT
jgi:SAM-dependent methyltransferase